MAPLLLRPSLAVAVALYIARRGLRRHSLSPSGAAAALLVGTVIMAADYSFGLQLLVFYLTGSAFTRYKAAVKATLDLEVRGGEGEREWTQVVATAGVPAALATAWLLRYGLAGARVGLYYGVDDTGSALSVAVLAAFACACGDTWASELGILSRSPPRLVVTCCTRPVRPGTNGGVSAFGEARARATTPARLWRLHGRRRRLVGPGTRYAGTLRARPHGAAPPPSRARHQLRRTHLFPAGTLMSVLGGAAVGAVAWACCIASSAVRGGFAPQSASKEPSAGWAGQLTLSGACVD
jgi:uncharacterized protein (TIGR00297 family)